MSAPAPSPPLTPFQVFWEKFLSYQRFVRLSAFGLTAMMPLLGAGSTAAALTWSRIMGLLAVALAFHQYGYVLNDYIDLPVDRLHPRRQNYPLVKGTIQPGPALLFALAQIPITFVLTAFLQGSWQAHGYLAVALLTGAIYNIWGKVISFPPITDAIQGVTWGSLVFYGMAISGQGPTPLTWFLAAYVVFFIILVNGVHGSLRDIVSDWAAGMKTTVIVLGARPDGEHGIVLSRRLFIYIVTLQILCSFFLLWPLLTNEFGYLPGTRWLVFTGVVILQLLSIRSEWIMLQTTDPKRVFGPMMSYIILSLFSLIALFAPYVSRPIIYAVLMSFFGPLLIYDTYYKPILQKLGWR